VSSASGSPGYGFGDRSAIDSGGTPHSQAVQYDPGVGGFRDTLYPEHSEDGAVEHATLDNGWHEISMEVVGDRYQASVDGRVIFTGTTPLTCGGLYIRIWRASIELKDLSVAPITALGGSSG
jgi:hypothetical protein